MSKKPATKSLNAWSAGIGLVIAALFTSQGVEVNIDPTRLAEGLLTKEGIGLIMFLATQLATPIIKTVQRIQKYGYDWRVLISRNFFAHTISALAVVLALWLDETTIGFVVALLTQGVNLGWHMLSPKELPGSPEKE